MNDLWIWMILLLIGFVAGTVGSIVGLGGGIIIVPALLYLAQHFTPFASIQTPVAVGTSLFLIIITSLASTLSYHKQKRIDTTSGWLFFLGCGPGAMIGAYFSDSIDSNLFLIGFGCFMLFVSGVLYIRDRIQIKRKADWSVMRTYTDEQGISTTYGYHRWIVILSSLAIGLISGMFGIGGGSLMVPLMLIVFGFPAHVATATSMFVIFWAAITGSLVQMVQGNIHWLAVLFLAPGSWLGGRAGAYISMKMSTKSLMILIRILLIIVAIKMIYDGFHT